MNACAVDETSNYAFDIGDTSDCDLCNAVVDGALPAAAPLPPHPHPPIATRNGQHPFRFPRSQLNPSSTHLPSQPPHPPWCAKPAADALYEVRRKKHTKGAVRHCLRLAIPLHSWLRQRLSFALGFCCVRG